MTRRKMISPYVFPGIKRSYLPDNFNIRQQAITPKEILEIISKETNVSIEQILGKKRDEEIIIARHILCGILRHEYRYAYVYIAKMLDKDHTTIISAARQYILRNNSEERFNKYVTNILDTIKQK
jgi:chromosomal replication initiator protein